MRARHMQGVPAHTEYLKSNGERRHMARCKFILKPQKICDCTSSPYFRERCGGSRHCEFYDEKEQK